MSRTSSAPNFAEYRTVGEAAAFLGVSASTLRNWDRTGKLKSRRHPQNGYRIYLHKELETVLRSADLSMSADEALGPPVNWGKLRESEHFVQFYEDDEFLADSVCEFVAAALSERQSSVVIATAEHRHALQRKLAACGINIAELIECGRYVVLDAADTLSKFMVGGTPDRGRFNETVGDVIARLAQGGRRIHAFGEMVALLWADHRREAAIRLEELWNELGRRHRFCLYCAYPIVGFGGVGDVVELTTICACHSRIVPAESYASLDDAEERLRAITLLQQKAHSLEAEISHRREVETALLTREQELADFFEKRHRRAA